MSASPKTLQMLVLPRKSDKKNVIEFIEEVKKCCNLDIEYSTKDKILNIKSEKVEYIIYVENPVDAINFLTGFRGGIADFSDTYMSVKPLIKGDKNESKN